MREKFFCVCKYKIIHSIISERDPLAFFLCCFKLHTNKLLLCYDTVVDLIEKTDHKKMMTLNLAIAPLEAMLIMQHINETFIITQTEILACEAKIINSCLGLICIVVVVL